MAAGGSLDDLLDSKVDETAISALVGTLEGHIYSDQPLSVSGSTRPASSLSISSNPLGHVRSNGTQFVKDEHKADIVSKAPNIMGVRSVSAYSQAGVIQTANFSSVSSVSAAVDTTVRSNVNSVVKMVNNSVPQIQSSVLPVNPATLSNGSVLASNGKQTVGIGAKIMDAPQAAVTQTVIAVNRSAGPVSSGALTGVVPANVVNSGVQIVNMNQLRTQSPALINQKALAPRVVLSPQVLNRANQPGQPVTLQTLQSLQGSTTGHLLVKTESGQLKLIQLPVQGAAAAAAGGAAVGTVGMHCVSSAASVSTGAAIYKSSTGTNYQHQQLQQQQQLLQQQQHRMPVPSTRLTTSSVPPSGLHRAPSTYYHPQYSNHSLPQHQQPQPSLYGGVRASVPPTCVAPASYRQQQTYVYQQQQQPHVHQQQQQQQLFSTVSGRVSSVAGPQKSVAVATTRTANVAPVAGGTSTGTVTGTPMASGAGVPVSVPVGVAAVQTAPVVQQQQRVTQTQSAMTPDTAKVKCKNFLATLLRLAKEQPDQVAHNVRDLIQNLIDARLEPETFTTKLQEELNSSPQPCLVPFLKKSLPYLRQSLYCKDITIDGVRPPPLSALSTPVASVPVVQVSRTQAVTVAPSVLTSNVSLQQQQQHQHHQLQQQQQGPVTAVRLVTAGANMTHARNVSTHPALVNVHPVSYQSGTMTSTGARVVRSIPSVTPSPAGTLTHASTVGRITARPSVVTGTSGYHQQSMQGVASQMVGGASSTVGGVSTTMGVSNYSNLMNRRDKARPIFKASFDSGHDDDINDVAAMGGVNLHEETQHILGSTEFVGTQIRSVKDEMLLAPAPLQARLRHIMLRHGLDEPPSPTAADLTALVSHAVEARLRSLLQRLSVIAEHRSDLVKCESRYAVSRDVRTQLRFLEELDRLERRRHEELEREILLRAAKSRSKTEDPEQAKLKAKAKEMQRVEMEEVRQREANLTALQAIGPRKKPRLDLDSGASSSGAEASTGTGSQRQLNLRQRVRRVNIRDLLFLLEQEKCHQRSTQLYKLLLR